MQSSEDESFSFVLDQSFALSQDVRPLEREKAMTMLETSMQAFRGNRILACRRLKEAALRLLTDEIWSSRKAGLQVVRLMLTYGFENKNDRMVEEAVREQLEHPEARVRQEAAETLFALTKLKNGGLAVWQRFGEALLASIEDQEQRKLKQAGEPGGSEESRVFQPPKPNSLMHDTEGWHSLDSSLRAVQRIIEGLSERMDSSFQDEIPNETSNSANTSISPEPASLEAFPLSTRLLELLLRLLKHQNRFVRETANTVISSIFAFETKIMRRRSSVSSPNSQLIDSIAARLASSLRDGLIDDFSHVTYAASNASRHFVLYLKLRAEISLSSASMPSPSTAHIINTLVQRPETAQNDENVKLFDSCLSIILPALCLNRYVSQDGLRAFSLQTWKMLVHQEGPKLVSFYLPQILTYYASLAGHHAAATRETAAYCLGELIKKVERARGLEGSKFNATFPSQIRQSLALLAQDHSWPVRDASCASIAHFLANYVEGQSDVDLYEIPNLLQLLLARLEDPLASVRETSSNAFTSLLERLYTQNTVPIGIRNIRLVTDTHHHHSHKMKVSEGGKDGGDSESDSDSDSDSEGEDTPSQSSIPTSRPNYDHTTLQILKLISSKLKVFINDPLVNEKPHHHEKTSSAAPHSHGSGHDVHLVQSGEAFFGPMSKMLHDNDPEVHKEQEIFSCECHANPHHCKSHALTSTDRKSWEIAQSGLFLLKELIQHRYTKNMESNHLIDSKVSKLVSTLVTLITSSKQTFSKYSTWMTSLVSIITSIFNVLAPLSLNEAKPTFDINWLSLIVPLFEIVEKQESIGASAVSNTRNHPMGPSPSPFASVPGAMPFARGIPGQMPLPTPVGRGNGPFPSGPLPSSSNVPLGTPGYAAAIKPSLAKASSSMLLIDASLTLLFSIYQKLDKSPFASLSSASHQRIFKTKVLLLANEGIKSERFER